MNAWYTLLIYSFLTNSHVDNGFVYKQILYITFYLIYMAFVYADHEIRYANTNVLNWLVSSFDLYGEGQNTLYDNVYCKLWSKKW